jgi:hypothetical protein
MNKKYNVKPEYKDILTKIVKKYLPECKIYLFGSRARQTNDPTADIDIVLDMHKPIDHYKLALIRDDIEESTIPFFVDVVDMQSISQEMKDQIGKEKIEWNN